MTASGVVVMVGGPGCDIGKNEILSNSRRDDNAAIVVAEDDVGAVGFGETRRALEEFFGIHDGRTDGNRGERMGVGQ